MIELSEIEEGLVFVRISGAIDQTQYQAMLPRMQNMVLGATAPLRVLCEIAEDAEVEPTVLWDDMQFGQANADQIGRMAIVGPPKWEGYVELLQDTDVDARLFAIGEIDAARGWAKDAG